MQSSQKQLIVAQLREFGEVSRNWALRNFISRLAAIILVLKKEGWEFIEEKRDGDYVYVVTKEAPEKSGSINDILTEWRNSNKQAKSIDRSNSQSSMF